MKHRLTVFFTVLLAFSVLSALNGCKVEVDSGKKSDTEKKETKQPENKTEQSSSENTSSGHSDDGTLTYDVVNNTGFTLSDIYVSPAESQKWGNDILPYDVFENGKTIRITIPPEFGKTCFFDMKITDTEGGHITFTNIDACKMVKLQINGDGTFEYLVTK